jgi:hypothetical protein
MLRSKVKKGLVDFLVIGLALEKGMDSHVGRKYHLSLSQHQDMKDIKNGKHSTIIRALGARKALIKGYK